MIFFKILLNITQPIAVLVFLVAGISSLVLGMRVKGLIYIAFSIANFLIFYGDRFIK